MRGEPRRRAARGDEFQAAVGTAGGLERGAPAGLLGARRPASAAAARRCAGTALCGAVGARALLDVDGIRSRAQVLGTLPRTAAQSQRRGWLLEWSAARRASGPGARAAGGCSRAAVRGCWCRPRAALREHGAYVYRRARAARPAPFHYVAVDVKPLARVGDGWLVQGSHDDDEIVVHGAGVLWSLEGVGASRRPMRTRTSPTCSLPSSAPRSGIRAS